jgi:aspartate aminotransferase-like enzyme
LNVQNLRLPGPTPIPPAVMEAMQRPMMAHRGDDFRHLHKAMISSLQSILITTSDVFVVPGSGSIGWEAAIVNTLSPGDEVISFITGDFGTRFASVAERFGLVVRRIEIEPGFAVTAKLVKQEIARYPDARAVLYTHNETSTGVMNPLEEIGPIVREHGALFIVDAVSSAGAVRIDIDKWEIDILLTGSQKGWMCPPGLAIVAANERAFEASEHAMFPRAFLDFHSWRSSVANGDTPATAPLTLYYALDAACRLILTEGIDARTERHEEAGRRTRQALSEAGLELFADQNHASSTVTSVIAPGGGGAKDLVKVVRERYDIEVAAGQSDLSDKIIRIGHMGWFEQEDIARAVAAVVACASVLAD